MTWLLVKEMLKGWNWNELFCGSYIKKIKHKIKLLQQQKMA